MSVTRVGRKFILSVASLLLATSLALPAVSAVPKKQSKESSKQQSITSKLQFQLASRLGLWGGILGMGSELMAYRIPRFPNFSWRGGFLSLSGKDSFQVQRNSFAGTADLLFYPQAPGKRPWNFYVGAGPSIILTTTGARTGTLGGQVMVGLEYQRRDLQLLLELGYGIYRTGFSPSFSGLNLITGVRTNI